MPIDSHSITVKLAAMTAGLMLSYGSAVCQSTYFPTNPGDSWTLADTSEFTQRIAFGGSLTVNSRSYFLLDIPFGRSDTLRIDSDGRVWEFLAGAEQVLFDFGAASQTIYAPPDSWDAKKVLVSRITVTTPLGTFENCIVFDIDRAMVLGDYSYAFAPDVGLVKAVDSTGVEYLLQAASVGGMSVATSKLSRRTNGDDWIVHPIPTSGLVTIQRRDARHEYGSTRLVVFDMQGKKVMTRELGASRESWQVDVSQLASGVYRAVMLQNGKVSSFRIVRR